MKQVRNLIALSLFALFTFGVAHLCSNVLKTESQGLLNYLAKVTFPAPHNMSGKWVMDMNTDVQFAFLGGWVVWVESDPEAGKANFISRETVNVTVGDIISFRFRISWMRDEPIPQVTSFIWNGSQICEDNGKTV